MVTSPVHTLLALLDSVRNSRPGVWQARCPAHDDASPSLSVKEDRDGTVLIKCWAGCSAQEVVNAVGLELRDLFPATTNFDHARIPQRERRPWQAIDVLRAVAAEVTVIAVVAGKLNYTGLDEIDKARLTLAIGRVFTAVSAVGA
ncbi:MAG: DNA primase [Burkholderiales bacterium]